jgi:hypothetical protein
MVLIHGNGRSARLHSSATAPPSPSFVEGFCQEFDPEHARYAPERGMLPVLILLLSIVTLNHHPPVTLLAKGIMRLADSMNNVIPILYYYFRSANKSV